MVLPLPVLVDPIVAIAWGVVNYHDDAVEI